MAHTRKILTSVVALGTAAALTLGGTFAWQSISQTAVDESSDIVNPGGRLHNDQWFINSMENNNDIYVENFTTVKDGEAMGTPIYARVRLEEYMEIVVNHGTAAQKVINVAGRKLDKETGEPLEDQNVASEQNAYDYEYVLHDFAKDFAAATPDENGNDRTARNATSAWWTWKLGKTIEENGDAVEGAEKPWYMPTFNTNKDSVAADLNGIYRDTLGGISDREAEQYDYAAWEEDSTKIAYEIWDNDGNLLDELENLSWSELNAAIEDGTSNVQEYIAARNIKVKQVEHTAKQVGDTKGLISMTEWMAKRSAMSEADRQDTEKVEQTLGQYWVYDTDGWVYWSSPINSGETTGLLLDGMSLNGVMDDTWYYDLKVTAQFVTADDAGKYNSTGFFANGETPTANAQVMLDQIGVDMEDVVSVTALGELQDAVANVKDGGIVHMDEDIIIRTAEALTFTGDKGKTVTLNLDGHTIQRSSSGLPSSQDNYLINVDGMTLTIENTVEGGGMRCDTTNLRGMCAKNGGVINVKGNGDYMGSVLAATAYSGSTINIYGGTWRMRGNDLKFADRYLQTYGSGQINVYAGKLISPKCLDSGVKIAEGSTLGAGDTWVMVTRNGN